MNTSIARTGLALLLLACLAAAPVSGQDDDLLAGVPEEYRSGVNRAFSSRNGSALKSAFAELDEGERVGAAFLLATMPQHRVGDVTGEILLDHVRHAYRARRELAWTKSLPEVIFLRYVLPILSGDEKMEAYRGVLWDEIVPLLKRKGVRSLEQAAIEVNKFCGSKVSFKPTPPEDSSPLEVMERGYGRCEEEGIFFNAVARTAGVPARIASTPYWTFKASNHAWCEVYTGGRGDRPWHFLGACEPASKLDTAWFTSDVKRAALVLSRAIGTPEDEQVLSTSGNVSVINSTRHYTKVCTMTVEVVDGEGKAVPRAKLTMYIFNEVGNQPYLRSVFRSAADDKGEFVFELGPGDYVLQAQAAGATGFAIAKSKPGRKATTEIVLGEPAPGAGVLKTEATGRTAIHLRPGKGAKGAIVAMCRLSEFPWEPKRFVKLEAAGAREEVAAGTWLLQTGKRAGDSRIDVSLQIVQVKEGETATVQIPGDFPKRAPRRPDGTGRYVLMYPR